LESLFADERFRVVTETLVDGLIVIDAHGVILYVNPACEKLFGYPEGALVGRNVSILMPPPDSDRHNAYLARHRETRVKRIIGIGREIQGLKSDGAVFPMYLSVREAELGGEARFAAVIYDLTEKKRTEEMLLHHQKLDAIGQLSGGLAHDFNNILSIIGGNLEMIAQADLSPAARRAIGRAQDAASRGARITQRLLAFARRQPLARETLNLNESIQNLADMLRQSVGASIAVNLALSPESAWVEADIDQFETALLNLAINARDAMPSGGGITIETDSVEFQDVPATLDELPPGRYVRVSVTDTGAGMAPETRVRAIEPYFTTKQAGAGTGLGLSMVYGFLKQLGGHLRIYSEIGRGTRVSLFFPRTHASVQQPVEIADAPVALGSGEAVLLVEDDPDVRLVTHNRLAELGYRVLAAANAAEALELVGMHGDIRAGVLDVVMPGGMDGHALADEIERLAPHIGLLLMSGYSPIMANKDRAHPDRPFLTKPVSRLKLATAVRQAIDRRA
jgi:PAS domain S-box-containing protein